MDQRIKILSVGDENIYDAMGGIGTVGMMLNSPLLDREEMQVYTACIDYVNAGIGINSGEYDFVAAVSRDRRTDETIDPLLTVDGIALAEDCLRDNSVPYDKMNYRLERKKLGDADGDSLSVFFKPQSAHSMSGGKAPFLYHIAEFKDFFEQWLNIMLEMDPHSNIPSKEFYLQIPESMRKPEEGKE